MRRGSQIVLNEQSEDDSTFGRRSSIAKIIESARKVNGKGLFDDTVVIQAGVTKNNNKMATYAFQMT